MPHTPHPFARFIAILGRGRNLSRALTLEEAEEAMTMILEDDVLPEQLGAFLMLLRVKEESAAELAGFVRRCAKAFLRRRTCGRAIDWSSYAGKKRQLPWFLLAALCLAQNGHSVFMHGFDGHTAGRLYTGEVLRSLGLAPAKNFVEAARDLASTEFRLYGSRRHQPAAGAHDGFQENPRAALAGPHAGAHDQSLRRPRLLQGIFHPNYMTTHRDAALLLGEKNMAVFRGEGGEIERRPGKPCETLGILDGVAFEERWPPLMEEPRQLPDESMELSRLVVRLAQ